MKSTWLMLFSSFTCKPRFWLWLRVRMLIPRCSVLGSESQSKRKEFQAALQFTQEYALLAASVEDRPFIPVSNVIWGGTPREFKALFRTWVDAKVSTQRQSSGKPSPSLIGLPQAIEAMDV